MAGVRCIHFNLGSSDIIPFALYPEDGHFFCQVLDGEIWVDDTASIVEGELHARPDITECFYSYELCISTHIKEKVVTSITGWLLLFFFFFFAIISDGFRSKVKGRDRETYSNKASHFPPASWGLEPGVYKGQSGNLRSWVILPVHRRAFKSFFSVKGKAIHIEVTLE